MCVCGFMVVDLIAFVFGFWCGFVCCLICFLPDCGDSGGTCLLRVICIYYLVYGCWDLFRCV